MIIKLVSPIYSQMNCGLFYAGVFFCFPTIIVVILTDHLLQCLKGKNQFSDAYSHF